MIRDSNTAMLGQYFKKKRALVELALSCSSGFGLAAVSFIVSRFLRYLIYRHTNRVRVCTLVIQVRNSKIDFNMEALSISCRNKQKHNILIEF